MEALFRLCDLLCGLFLLLQVALSDRLFLDLSPSSENGFIAAEVNVSRCDVAQALVVALMIVMIDKGFEFIRQTTSRAQAHAEGKYKGRVPTAMKQADKVKALVDAGVTRVQVQEQLGISKASYYRCLKAS